MDTQKERRRITSGSLEDTGFSRGEIEHLGFVNVYVGSCPDQRSVNDTVILYNIKIEGIEDKKFLKRNLRDIERREFAEDDNEISALSEYLGNARMVLTGVSIYEREVFPVRKWGGFGRRIGNQKWIYLSGDIYREKLNM